MSYARSGGAAGRFLAGRPAALLLLTGLLPLGVPASPAWAQDAPPPVGRSGAPYTDHVAEAAARFEIPPAWILAVMRVESAGDPRAVSRAGAMGLMQVMPATWTAMRLRYRLGGDPFDPRDNILAGAAYLREMHDRYGAPGFLAAYNAGPGRYEEHLATGRPLPAETRAYLASLAPAMGGDGSEIAAVDPLAWTRAPLFIVHSAGAPQTDTPTPSGAPSAVAERSHDRHDAIFVARAPSAGAP